MKNTHHQSQTRADDELKSDFLTKYRLFQYLISLFQLTNLLPSCNPILIQYLGLSLTLLSYFIKIINSLVFLLNFFQYEKINRKILEVFFKLSLYVKLNKCLFVVNFFIFLSFILIDKGIDIEENCISTILNGFYSKSIREIGYFLEFANFYHRLIKEFLGMINSLKAMISKKPKEIIKN